MADMNDLFLFGDDFDAILDILENEEELEEDFTEAVNGIQHDDNGIICELCQKKCKSKTGLKKHTRLPSTKMYQQFENNRMQKEHEFRLQQVALQNQRRKGRETA
ncbi:hypothetical protein QZH41_011859 [Actinostola sp. cb2023]|nr:hypothetical protein QZH41_011859 [Actinostola sp. cb2023]